MFVALPYGLQFTSKPASRHGNQYAVQWVVSSYSPLVDFTLNVKQVSVNFIALPAGRLVCHTNCNDCTECHLTAASLAF